MVLHHRGPLMPTFWTRRRFSFRAHLVVFALLVALPVTVLAGVLLAHAVNLARAQAETRLLQLAQSLSQNIDRDVERHVPVLNTLAAMPSFGADWMTFHDRATRALQGDGYIVVSDRSLRQLVNTYVPYGDQPARTGDIETAERVLASQRMEVSGVFTSLVTGGRVINVDVPVVRNGRAQYILMYGRPIEHLTSIMEEQSLDPGWSSSVFDRQGTLITRLGDERPHRQPTADTNGVSRLRDSDGEAFLRATHTSQATGWTVAVDAPLSLIMLEANRSLRLWALFAAGTLFLAIGLGVLFGQFLRNQLHRTAAYATAIGRQEDAPAPEPTTLDEIGLITEALQNARAELTRRMDQQRLLSRELNHRVKNVLSVVQAVVTRTFTDTRPIDQSRALAAQRLQALARSQDLLTRTDWTELPLREIIELEIAPFADRVEREGPDLMISSHNVQNFGLILHELMTNAVKYGALRDGAGTISVRWSVSDGAGAPHFQLQWKEHCQAPALA
jgi:two-component sensor histidine kinase